MGVALDSDHEELASVVRAFLARHRARAAARSALDGGRGLPAFWGEAAELGWLGLHLPEEHGGSGFGVMELAVVVDEMGRECTPGPFLPTVVAAGAINACGSPEQRSRNLPGLAAGDVVAGLGLHGDLAVSDQGLLTGEAPSVLGGPDASLFVLAAGADLVLVARGAPGLRLDERDNLDPTRLSARVVCEGVEVDRAAVVVGAAATARRLFRVLAAAEAAGMAAACADMAAAYAKDRVAFGRPIGQFQAVKHLCANALLEAQIGAAAAWDAARVLGRTSDDAEEAAALAAAAVAVPAAVRAAQLNIQVHGGIGFTWEHDAHLYLRRAGALQAVVGPMDELRQTVARLTVEDADAASARLDLPAEADAIRDEVRAFAAEYWACPEPDRHALVVERGYLFPHWPEPWGKGASPLEQLVIEEELADVPREEGLGRTAWIVPIVLPTIMVYGTEDQKERWIRPTLAGTTTWCQLFSEPGSGSDLAGLSTKAARDGDGWRVTGQKVWTSDAHNAARGFALVRTDPDAPKHRGITCMVIDMHAPGVTIRPLRQITGSAEFNEVFLDDVFVPDADVVGEVNRGWTVARTSLDAERVSVGSGPWSEGPQWSAVLRRIRKCGASPGAWAELGDAAARVRAIRAMNLRVAARAVAGGEPGVEGTLTKLLSAEHLQKVADLALRLLGPEGVYLDGDDAALAGVFLWGRMATIAGGTSEILRNVIAERVLGLPREPQAQ